MRKNLILFLLSLTLFILYVSGQYSRSTVVTKIILNSKVTLADLQSFVNKTKGAQIWINSLHKLFVFLEIPKVRKKEFLDYANESSLDFQFVTSAEKSLFVAEFISVRNNPILNRTGLIDFNSFLTYEEIIEYIDLATERKYQQVSVEKVLIGLSFQNRFIYAIEIKKLPKTKKMGVLLNCGAIASDWLSIMGCINTINFLILLDEKEKEKILDVFDIYIIPLSNPDGYAYSKTFNYKWKKNRRKLDNLECNGVNLEGNFKDSFLKTPEPDVCADDYGGETGFSETETKALRKYFLEKRCAITFFISVATSKNKTFSYSYIPNFKKPKNLEQYDFLTKNAENILMDHTGYLYRPRKFRQAFPNAKGSTCEWVYQNTLVEFSFHLGLYTAYEDKIQEPIEIKRIHDSLLYILQSFSYDAKTSSLINFYS